MNVRVVGTGSIGRRYLRILLAMHERGLLHEPPRAISVHGGLTHGAPDSESLVASALIVESMQDDGLPPVDLTIIATQTVRHVPDAQRFGQWTKRMLVEKPVATTFQEACELAPLAQHVPTSVCAPLRFMRGSAATRAGIARIGPLTAVHVRCQSWLPDWRPATDYRHSYSADPTQGGVLRDLVHEIDMAIHLFGMPESLSAVLRSDPELGIDVETTADMTWQYEGFTLSMVLDYVSRVPSRGIDAHGTSGAVHWDVLEGSLAIETREGSDVQSFDDDRDRDVVLERQIMGSAAPAATPGANTCARLADGMRALAICELAKASAAIGGQPVPIRVPQGRS